MSETSLHVAMGDPQTDIMTVFDILEVNGLLASDGRLSPGVRLVSMGDHFDWGPPAERARAAESGLALLDWLASHDPEQVTILVGNHDLARVGELFGMDDASFARAEAEADRGYYDGEP